MKQFKLFSKPEEDFLCPFRKQIQIWISETWEIFNKKEISFQNLQGQYFKSFLWKVKQERSLKSWHNKRSIYNLIEDECFMKLYYFYRYPGVPCVHPCAIYQYHNCLIFTCCKKIRSVTIYLFKCKSNHTFYVQVHNLFNWSLNEIWKKIYGLIQTWKFTKFRK